MGPYECPDLAALNRQLAAMRMSIPVDVATALQEEQRRHLAGELGSYRAAARLCRTSDETVNRVVERLEAGIRRGALGRLVMRPRNPAGRGGVPST